MSCRGLPSPGVLECGFRFGDGGSGPCLAAEERVESAQVVDAFVVVQLRELVRREQFAAGALVVGGVAAGHALRVERQNASNPIPSMSNSPSERLMVLMLGRIQPLGIPGIPVVTAEQVRFVNDLLDSRTKRQG